MASTAPASSNDIRDGDRVSPTSGEFAGRVGVVAEVRVGLVIVEYQIFGKQVPVEHDPDDLVRID